MAKRQADEMRDDDISKREEKMPADDQDIRGMAEDEDMDDEEDLDMEDDEEDLDMEEEEDEDLST
jgi:hypothetical protein